MVGKFYTTTQDDADEQPKDCIKKNWKKHSANKKKEMTDSEILDEVYNRLSNMLESNKHSRVLRKVSIQALRSFVEQEWQREDELIDAREIERREGLEIGEDGTVKE